MESSKLWRSGEIFFSASPRRTEKKLDTLQISMNLVEIDLPIASVWTRVFV